MNDLCNVQKHTRRLCSPGLMLVLRCVPLNVFQLTSSSSPTVTFSCDRLFFCTAQLDLLGKIKLLACVQLA